MKIDDPEQSHVTGATVHHQQTAMASTSETPSTTTVVMTINSTDLYLKSLPSSSATTPLPPFPTSIPHTNYIPNTRFLIDAFPHAGPFTHAYFLSHFHSDHYTTLSSSTWSHGLIFSSPTTSSLLHHTFHIPSNFLYPLPLNTPFIIDECEVILVEANHCPGAVQFLFKVPIKDSRGKLIKHERYIHTGDFRFHESMTSNEYIRAFTGCDAVFLDTTYCNPKYVFPRQEESIDYVVEVVKSIIEEESVKGAGVLFLVATYVVGKEKILLEIARRCGRKVYVDERKMRILRVLGLGESNGVFTEVEGETNVHVVGWNVLGETWPFFRPNFVRMKEIMIEKGYERVVGFVPTGWTYEVKKSKFSVRKKDGCMEVHLVPYSEHSNYEELREYVKFLKPKHVVPTVGMDVGKVDSKHAEKMRKHFAGLVDEMAVKQEFIKGFNRPVTGEVEDEKLENPCSLSSDKLAEEEDEDVSSGPKCGKEPENVASSSFPQDVQASVNIDHFDEADVEESIQELKHCLPSWATRNQMMDILRSSGRNVVEAVSTFYEHEMEFHEQVTASTSSAWPLQEMSQSDPALPFELTNKQSAFSSKQGCVKSLGSGQDVSLSQSTKLPKTQKLNNSGKRKKNQDSRPTKKARTNLKLDSSGPKQCTITKFFGKLQSSVPLDDRIKNAEKQSFEDKTEPSDETPDLYKVEVDQFIQIINGGASLRYHAAAILEKTKGDINMALDIYYGDTSRFSDENKDILSGSGKSIQGPCTIESASVQDAKVSNIVVNVSDTSSLGNQTESATLNYVSLPPEKYSPVEHACWKKGEPAPYLHLARTFDLVEDEKGKIKAASMLCNMFRSLLALSPEDVLPATYLCTNKIAPDHENMELNIGGTTVVAALEEVCGTNRAKVRDLYNTLGDLGDVAQVCRQTQSLLVPPSALSVRGVYSTLRKISLQAGSGSTSRKKGLIVSLMRSCREKEMKFLVRTLVRNLRIGAMMRTVLPALAQAVAMNYANSEGPVENMKEQLQSICAAIVEAYNILPTLDLLIPSLLERGIKFSSMTLTMVPGIPIKPMLAKIANGVPQVLKLFHSKAFTCEYKYDGQRAQIHKLSDGSIRVFSRNGDETTLKFPDLINIIKELCGPAAQTFILDAEVVAIDRKNGLKLMSFQELSSRERGSKDSLVTVDRIKVDICIILFDIMFANGKQLLEFPLRERRKYIKDLFEVEKPGHLEYAREMTVEADSASADNEATLTKISCFLDDALRSSCEGIMVKFLDVDAGYTPSRRSDAWLKVKRDYVEGLNDSLDLVPIGAWHGNGRKAGWYSPFLMACYNTDTEEFQSVCRVMSGFSDSFYSEMKEFFSGDRLLSKKPPYYRTGESPDVWFSPELVWEIRGADFTVSPVHHAAIGLVHPSRGISVRFPRFVRSVLDRNVEECSTSTDIAEMFHAQTRKMDVGTEH